MLLKISRDVPFNPENFIGEGWSIVWPRSDKRATALTSVDFEKINLATCLEEGEPSITGEKKLERLRKGGDYNGLGNLYNVFA